VAPQNPDEAALLTRCVHGDSAAWQEFLDRFRPALQRAARATLARVLGAVREDDLESIVEGTLLAIVKDNFAVLRGFGGRCSLGGYLQVIATRTALNHVRGERRKGWLRFRPLDAVADRPIEDPQEAPDAARLDSLRKALEKLPPRDQLILKLFHLDGAQYKEIAGILGLSPNAVSPALIRARQKLRALLGEDR